MPNDCLTLSQFLLDNAHQDLVHSDRRIARCDRLLVHAATHVADSKRKLAAIFPARLERVPE